jgi:hypothetical protein
MGETGCGSEDMPATIHAGAQFRWHEELCRIQVPRLREVAIRGGRALAPGHLPHKGGVYCFWWTGDRALLSDPTCNRVIELRGPGGRIVRLELDDEWLGLRTDLPIPLYVGKAADSIAKRVGQHLRLAIDRVTPTFEGHRKQARPTTSCQVRAGIEHFFPQLYNSRDLVLDHIGLSLVILDGDEHSANRFYLEDLAVGLMRPPLNIDIER